MRREGKGRAGQGLRAQSDEVKAFAHRIKYPRANQNFGPRPSTKKRAEPSRAEVMRGTRGAVPLPTCAPPNRDKDKDPISVAQTQSCQIHV